MRFGSLWCSSFLVLVLIGCSGSGTNLKLAPVKGTVTYLGKPVAGATVTFMAEGAPRLAIGETDSEGNYVLSIFEKNDGAVVGQNSVTISSAATAGPPVETSNIEEYEKKMGMGKFKDLPKVTPPLVIPQKYADAKKPLFKVNVVAGSNQHDFKLQD